MMYPNSVFEQLALWNPHETHPKESISSGRERGAVYTRRETVDFILNLAGYLPDRPLHNCTLLEPSFGNGDFLVGAVERLVTSYLRIHSTNTAVYADARGVPEIPGPVPAADQVAALEWGAEGTAG